MVEQVELEKVEQKLSFQRDMLSLEFPMCQEAIQENYNCEIKANRWLGTQNIEKINQQCADSRTKRQFCLMSIFCKNETHEFRNCMNGSGMEFWGKCPDQWKQLEGCMIRKTEEYENNEKKIETMRKVPSEVPR